MSQFNTLLESFKTQQRQWLVTGCAGFIGSNLAEFLLRHNQKVIGLDNFSTGHQKNIDAIRNSIDTEFHKNFTFVEGDICDYSTCKKICHNVDIILHQAALGSVPRSLKDPITSNLSNVTGFLNLLTAAKDADVTRFVYASSSSVYGDSPELPKVESRTGNLLSPYAVTKRVNELYADVFSRSYGINTIGLRYFNVFGKRQDPLGAYAAVIPKWIQALLHGQDVTIYGDGETSRDFCYIDNVIQANLLAATTQNKDAISEVFNIAVSAQTTLNELYDLIVKQLKKELPDFNAKEALYEDFRAGDIRHSNANINKAKELLGYLPSHTIDEGMQQSIKWYIKNVKQ
ncbi:MAG: SDR family oxidoreductase [Campylobacterota bacterium]|nr:SDR family oxidoreductase [Campylobacterota bacterium]